MALSKPEDWRDPARRLIISLFGDNLEVLSPVLLYLDLKEDCQEWRSLDDLLPNENGFKAYVQGLAKSITKGDRNKELQGANTPNVGVNLLHGFGFAGLARAWRKLPSILMNNIKGLMSSGWNLLGDLAGAVREIGGSIIQKMWSAVYFGFETLTQITKWWWGKITGSECVKIIVDTWLITIAGCAGAAGGGVLGFAVLGPLGGLIGGYLGGVMASRAMEANLRNRMNARFNQPKSVVHEDAYARLGVDSTATPKKTRKNFLESCANAYSSQLLHAKVSLAIIEAAVLPVSWLLQ